MGKITGFLEIEREDRSYEPASDRIRHYREFVIAPSDAEIGRQAARCMDCGIPYCHTGCPVNNQIPDWNDLVYHADWQHAAQNLHSTNNFPEVTGRVCPAPCEAACTLNIIDAPVTIKSIECTIADKAFAEGWVTPLPPETKTGKRIAIVGSGPAGLAAAQQLARAGHDVHVYEKNAYPGGLLRYGIPDFKMEKVHRRAARQADGGRRRHFPLQRQCRPRTFASRSSSATMTQCCSPAAPSIRAISPCRGRELAGVHFAMNFLPQQNRRVSGEPLGDVEPILAEGKQVVVIGGGDTGSDCIGTSFRQGALSVTQLEILPQPPEQENKALTWPNWPLKFRTSSSQAEGAARDFAVATTRFIASDGRVQALECIRLDSQMKPLPGTEFQIPADLVLLAMGFMHPVQEGIVKDLKLDLDPRGNVKANELDYRTSRAKVFAAGDMRRGQSLVVWAIREGRQAAHAVDKFLMGKTSLPR